MYALSIRQPYAWLIVNGIKDIENRTWSTPRRGLVAVHAGVKKMTRDDWAWLREVCEDYEVPAPAEADIRYGGIVGVMDIADVVTDDESEWFEGPYGFVIARFLALPFMPCTGRLGFFNVDLEVEDGPGEGEVRVTGALIEAAWDAAEDAGDRVQAGA